MSCSSDDDSCFYSNITQKLQALKNNYKQERVESAEVESDDSSQDVLKWINEKEKKNKELDDEVKALNLIPVTDFSETETVSKSENTAPKYMTRRSARLRNMDVTQKENVATGRNEKGKRKSPIKPTPATASNTSDFQPVPELQPRSAPKPPPKKNSRRGRGNNVQRRGCFPRDTLNVIASYTFDGDVADVDKTAHIPIFSSTNNNKSNAVIADSDDEDSDNEELSVKVIWQSCECVRFSMRKHQKLKQIFDFFSKRENIPFEKLYFAYNDKRFSEEDTPDSIQYNIAKFIDSGVVSKKPENETRKLPQTKGIAVKFQIQDQKRPIEIRIEKTERIRIALIKCSEQLEKPVTSLRFHFDGEELDPRQTPEQLEMEGGECIDVQFVD